MQHLAPEDFGWGVPVKAFSGGVVVGLGALRELVVAEQSEIGFARQGSSHAADGILHPALLPWCVGVAEEGFDIVGVEFVVPGELGAVVEGDGLACGNGTSRLAIIRAMGAEDLPGGRAAMSSREDRSCRVRIAWPYLANIMRSASQWPGTERSAAVAGLSAIGTRASI